MLTRIDHVMICVPDLQQGIDTYMRLGFTISVGGVHPGQGTHNAIAFHEEDYLELLSVRDRDEYRAGHAGGGLLEFLARGGGLRYIAVQSDDLVADVTQMRQRGVDVSDPSEGARRTPTGTSRHCPSAARRRRLARIPTGCSAWIACTLPWPTWRPRRRPTAMCSGCQSQRCSAARSSKRTW
jgi:catechol 2,3-dioxygenase-like lactoylglutathione lyase family enzyme